MKQFNDEKGVFLQISRWLIFIMFGLTMLIKILEVSANNTLELYLMYPDILHNCMY